MPMAPSLAACHFAETRWRSTYGAYNNSINGKIVLACLTAFCPRQWAMHNGATDGTSQHYRNRQLPKAVRLRGSTFHMLQCWVPGQTTICKRCQ